MYEAFLERGGGARKYNINFKAVFYGGLNTVCWKRWSLFHFTIV